MDKFLDFCLMFLTQIAGGPGPAENNLVRFALPAIFWAVLLAFAWSGQRHGGLPRERLLVWSQILLIGLDLACSRLLVLNSHQHLTPTMKDLCQVIQAETGQQARSPKGGAMTEPGR